MHMQVQNNNCLVQLPALATTTGVARFSRGGMNMKQCLKMKTDYSYVHLYFTTALTTMNCYPI